MQSNLLSLEDKVKQSIREVPDFPKPGINFKDITTLLQDIELFNEVIEHFTRELKTENIHHIIGIESRGFIFAVPLAMKLNVPFIPVRKPNKLPADTHRETYALEYGEDSLEIHLDAFKYQTDENVLIVDDLLATGGTALATSKLVTQLGAAKVSFLSLIELSFLNGREKLENAGLEVKTLIKY
ncbi:MAG: adenine phosphoribosyltransferase [Proteobacteria bacterium]|jgi:adenine phosphoribosyltransferase|nr:adenine phosphoribosyltransferase [Pseudomonadota bacterium]